MNIAQSAGVVEYTSRIPADGLDSPYECPIYDTKQSDGDPSVIQELWGMRSNPSLPSLPGPLWSGVVASDSVLSIGQIDFFKILTVQLC